MKIRKKFRFFKICIHLDAECSQRLFTLSMAPGLNNFKNFELFLKYLIFFVLFYLFFTPYKVLVLYNYFLL